MFHFQFSPLETRPLLRWAKLRAVRLLLPFQAYLSSISAASRFSLFFAASKYRPIFGGEITEKTAGAIFGRFRGLSFPGDGRDTLSP